MSAELVRLDLRVRRRSLIGYSVGMAVYALVIVALYPAFKNDTSLDQFARDSATVAALVGVSGSLTSPSGWLNANLYANFVPLVVLLITIGYGASCVAGQAEDGTLGLVVTLPVSRRRIAAEKLAASMLQATPVAVITGLCVLAGRGFGLDVTAAGLVGVTVGVVLLGAAFGALSILVGALTGSRGVALGVASSAAAASYLVSSLAPAVSWLNPTRRASLFFYAVGDGQLAHGLGLRDAVVLVTAVVVLSGAALLAFDRLDVR